VHYSEIELPIAALMAATGEPCFMKWSDGQFREHFDTIIHEAL
jgi:hypothetical protein